MKTLKVCVEIELRNAYEPNEIWELKSQILERLLEVTQEGKIESLELEVQKSPDNLKKMLHQNYPQLPELVVDKVAQLLREKEPLLEERIKKVCSEIKLSEEQSDVLADFGAEVAANELTYLEALLIAAFSASPASHFLLDV